MPVNPEHASNGMAHNARLYFRHVVDDDFTIHGRHADGTRDRTRDRQIPAGDLRNFNPIEDRSRRAPDYERLHSLSTFSPDLAEAAGARPKQRGVTGHITHQYLAAVSQDLLDKRIEGVKNSGAPRAIIEAKVATIEAEMAVVRAYSRNSLPFHHVTREQRFWDANEYANMSPETLRRYFGIDDGHPQGDPELAQRTINELNGALHALPHANYDVSRWSKYYHGKMAFRGAKVGHPADEGRVVYLSEARSMIEQAMIRKGSMPSRTGGMIREGALVTNTDFMSTSAQPQVAAEFGIRLMDVPAGRAGIDDSSAPENRTPGSRIKAEDYTVGDHLEMNENRIFFRIDHKSGRNICSETTEKQAEILFPQGCLYEVRSITRDHDLGNMVDLVEIDPKTHIPGDEVRNIMTGRVETDWFRNRQNGATT